MSDDIIQFPQSETDGPELGVDYEGDMPFDPSFLFGGGGPQSIKTTIELPRYPGDEDHVTLHIDSTVHGGETSVDLHVEGSPSDEGQWYALVDLVAQLMGSHR